MKLLFFRFVGCSLGLLAACMAFDVRLSMREIIPCVIFMTLLYTFLRPLMNLVVLPFNMITCGVVGVFADALLVKWAVGHNFGYLQALLIAVIIAVCYLPYGRYKRFRV